MIGYFHQPLEGDADRMGGCGVKAKIAFRIYRIASVADGQSILTLQSLASTALPDKATVLLGYLAEKCAFG